MLSAGSGSPSGSNSTTSAPAARNNSACSAYAKLNALPAAIAMVAWPAGAPPMAVTGSQGASPTLLPAAASTASTSTWRAINAVIASTASRARRPYSTAVTRPRYRVGSSSSALRGMAPTTGTPACSHACRKTCSWRALPTRLRMTPAMRVLESNVEKPCSSAAMLWLWPRASTTRITGVPNRFATCALEPVAGPATACSIRPSKRPITPSTTAMSAPCAPCAYSGPMSRSPTNTGSKLRPGRPAARAW